MVHYTGLDEDAQLFKVGVLHLNTLALTLMYYPRLWKLIRPRTEIINLAPSLERMVDRPPELPEWPRLRCIIPLYKQDSPLHTEHVQIHTGVHRASERVSPVSMKITPAKLPSELSRFSWARSMG